MTYAKYRQYKKRLSKRAKARHVAHDRSELAKYKAMCDLMEAKIQKELDPTFKKESLLPLVEKGERVLIDNSASPSASATAVSDCMDDTVTEHDVCKEIGPKDNEFAEKEDSSETCKPGTENDDRKPASKPTKVWIP